MFHTISALPEQPPLHYLLLRVLVTVPTLIMPPGYGMHFLHAYALQGLYLHSVKPSKPTTTTLRSSPKVVVQSCHLPATGSVYKSVIWYNIPFRNYKSVILHAHTCKHYENSASWIFNGFPIHRMGPFLDKYRMD